MHASLNPNLSTGKNEQSSEAGYVKNYSCREPRTFLYIRVDVLQYCYLFTSIS